MVLAFEARITGGNMAPTPEALEVCAFAPDVIPWSGIAFKTTYFALSDWLARRHPELQRGDPETWRH